ncbi:hypothetical protein L596_001336 [Steinernema carpocapsae]|uniref:Uncharacterized protein n=1 Tax=Steinernema carpocapsae TaxID=34508 RepID=A0A4U8UKY6_STECR|nr:hypothetical protein L596_001336 [Steinernema carpocapsae]
MLPEVHYSLFAADLKIYAFSNHCVLKKVLTALVTWSAEWGLPISESKTRFMHVGRNEPKVEYVLNDSVNNKWLNRHEQYLNCRVIF